MKKFICVFILSFSAIFFVQAQDEVKFYGEKINEKGAAATDKLEALMKGKEKIKTKLSGEIIETCSKKGCWMTVAMKDGQKLLVRFKDYGFFVPKEGVNGKIATFEGIAKKEIIDVATLRHYAEDAGKSKAEIEAINKSEEKFTFEAVGVIIKDAK